MAAHEYANRDTAKPSAVPARTPEPASPGMQNPVSLAGSLGNRAFSKAVAQSETEGSRGATTQLGLLKKLFSKPGRRLTKAERRPMEQHTGHSFARVQAYEGHDANLLMRIMKARAATVEQDKIVLGEGGKDQGTLNHELTHVFQRAKGAVQAKDDGSGVAKSTPGNPQEREAAANEHLPPPQPASTPQPE
jgi:hypothetical protein